MSTPTASKYHTWDVVQSVSGIQAGDPNTSVMPGWQWLHSTPVRLRAHGEMLSQGQGLLDDGLPSQQYRFGQGRNWMLDGAAPGATKASVHDNASHKVSQRVLVTKQQTVAARNTSRACSYACYRPLLSDYKRLQYRCTPPHSLAPQKPFAAVTCPSPALQSEPGPHAWHTTLLAFPGAPLLTPPVRP